MSNTLISMDDRKPSDMLGAERVVVAEATHDELMAPSGIEDMSNLDAIRFIEEAIHRAKGVGQNPPTINLNMNGRVSPEGNARNSKVTREANAQRRNTGKLGDYTYAVVSTRPPTWKD